MPLLFLNIFLDYNFILNHGYDLSKYKQSALFHIISWNAWLTVYGGNVYDFYPYSRLCFTNLLL